MSLLETIKMAALAVGDAEGHADYLFGVVADVCPLAVRVDSRFTLGEGFLVVPEHVADGGLAKGDKLVLLRKRGGAQYLILGKV